MSRFKKRIVIKVGSNVLTNSNNKIVRTVLDNIVRQIAYLYEHDIIAVLVSSGAAIAGKEVLGEIDEKDSNTRRQIFCSVGQPRLMTHYYQMFNKYGLNCAQVLATKNDFSVGEQRENTVNCYEGLFNQGIIPVANEDDTISLSMTTFTDNDELASLIAFLVDADMMILLTDMDGLFDGHPEEEDSTLVQQVSVNQNVEKFIQASTKKEGEGRGGMESKVKVAKDAARKNIPTVIANGKKENTIIDLVINNESVGTEFVKRRKK